MSVEPIASSNPSNDSPGPVIVFDGICVLCNRWVKFILRHDVKKQFLFASMQSESGKQLLTRHGLSPDDPISFLLVDEQGGHGNTNAIIRVLTRLGGVWKMMAVLRVIPSFVRDAAYRKLARNRYRWFGKRDSCMVPTTETASRFIQ